MAKKIIWSPRSISNLEGICEYISQDSESYASFFAERIMSMVKSLPRFPYSGRMVPEYEDENLREKIYKNYRIVYRVKKDAIEIVTIAHGAMLLKDL
jgi:plasmid stabilization system protein ParE